MNQNMCIYSRINPRLINFQYKWETYTTKKTRLSQRFQTRWDSPKKHWDRVKIPIPAFFFLAPQTAVQ